MDLLNELESLFDEPKKETPAVVTEERELFTNLPFIEAHQQYCNAYGYIVPKKYRDQFWDPAQKQGVIDDMVLFGQGAMIMDGETAKHIPVEEVKKPTDVIGNRPPGMEEAMIRNGVIPDVNVKSPADNKPEPIKIDVPLSEPQQLAIEPNTDDKGQANLFDTFNFVETPIDEVKGKETLDFYKDKMAGMSGKEKTVKGKFIHDKEKEGHRLKFVEDENGPWNIIQEEKSKLMSEEEFKNSEQYKSTPMLDKALQQSENVTPMFAAGIDPYKKDDALGEVIIFNKGVETIFENEEKGKVLGATNHQGVGYTTLDPVIQINGQDFIQLIVLGDPNAQKRHRSVKMGNHISQYDPSAGDKADFLAVVQKYAPAEPLKGPIKIHLTCFFSRPKNHYRTGSKSNVLKDDAPLWHISRPDSDNLQKFVMDALNGIYWKDDSQVCYITCFKQYDNETPRTIIEISRP